MLDDKYQRLASINASLADVARVTRFASTVANANRLVAAISPLIQQAGSVQRSVARYPLPSSIFNGFPTAPLDARSPTLRMPEGLSSRTFAAAEQMRFASIPEYLRVSRPELDRLFGISKAMKGALAKAAWDLGPVAENWRQNDLLDKAGWLPHRSMPRELIAAETDADLLSEKLEQHYRTNWEEAKTQLLEDMVAACVDPESAACFREALEAHEAGLHRLVCRGLFPDIERITRNHFAPSSFGGMASVPQLRQEAGELPLGPRSSWKLFEKLELHIYKHVKDAEALSKFENSKVPNRHAAIHGQIVYSSFVNSINAIFMTCYVFCVLKEIRAIEGEVKGSLSAVADDPAEL